MTLVTGADWQGQLHTYLSQLTDTSYVWNAVLLAFFYALTTILMPPVVGLFGSGVRTASISSKPTTTFSVRRRHTKGGTPPPCEIVLQQAELTNCRNGHENLGFLSREAGFFPLNGPLRQLPASHAVWDQVADQLPALVQSQTLRDTVNRMPLLSADVDSLPDRFVHRASTVLALIAHAYVRLDGETSLTDNIPHDKILPRSLEQPWSQVCKRLDRHATFMTYVDIVVYNWKSKYTSWQDLNLDTIELMVKTVANKEEHAFYGCMIEITALCVPLISDVIDAQKGALNNNPALVKEALISITKNCDHIMRVTLDRINASTKHASYTDPIVWAKSVANLAVPWVKGVPGAAGTSHPFFHMMDEFVGRKTYKQRLGIEAQDVRRDYPIHWRQFIAAISEISVGDFVKQTADPSLTEAWDTLMQTYGGSSGILGFHKRKVFGYLAVSFRIGRNSTINGFRGKPVERPWMDVHAELEKARNERDHKDESDPHAMPSRENAPRKARLSIPVHELLRHTNKINGFWFAAQGYVYDATKFMGKHPGGERIMELASGRDATSDLAALSHFSDRKIRQMMDHYIIGRLDVRRFASSAIQELYDRSVALAYKLSDLERTYANHMTFLSGKLTGHDRPDAMTAQKARFFRITNLQMREQYVPTVAAYMDGMVEVLKGANPGADPTRLQGLMNQFHVPNVPAGGFDSFERYDMNQAKLVVRKNTESLLACKTLITEILSELHQTPEETAAMAGDGIASKLEEIVRRSMSLGTFTAA